MIYGREVNLALQKLTNAAELYLKEYYALKIAEEEVNRHLESLLQRTLNFITEEMKSQTSEFYKWEINNNREGRFELSPQFKENVGIFEKDKKMISLLYRDVRDYKHFSNTNSVRISIFCRKNFRESLSSIPEEDMAIALNKTKELGINLELESSIPSIFSTIIEIDISNVEKAAKVVAEEMLGVQKGVVAFINRLIKNN